MADPELVKQILKNSKYGGSSGKGLFDSLLNQGVYGKVERALDSGLPPNLIEQSLSTGGINALDRLITANQQVAASKSAPSAPPGYKWQNNNGQLTIQPDTAVPTGTPPAQTQIQPGVMGGMAQWLVDNGILTAEEIANSDPQIVLAIAKDAGYFSQFKGGEGSGRTISPSEIAAANAQNILNNFNPEIDLIRLPGTTKALIRGTSNAVDLGQPGNYKPVLDDKGIATGYMVDAVTGATINASGNRIAADTLAHNIENDKAQLEIQRQNAATSAQATKQTGEYQAGSLAETIRSNKASEQRAADQLEAQKAETIAKLQADPGNFVQREFTIRGLTTPSEVAAQEQARIDANDPVKQKLLADQQRGAALAAAWNAGMNTGDFTDFTRGGGTAEIPKFATGGMTTAPQMIVGDPQQGQPMGNPEIVSNPTQAPISVEPVNGVETPKEDNIVQLSKILADAIKTMHKEHMKGESGGQTMPESMPNMPKFAYGTTATLRNAYGFAPTSDQDISELPSIKSLSSPDYTTTLSKNPTFRGAFGSQLPEARGINYGSYLQLREDPISYGLLSSLYRSGSRNLDAEASIAKRFAPIGNAYRGTVRT